ncbi:hypothetical protein [Aporhodopirellula aestuarii]|uniref:Uncharacterized protein n=1 Tax=Aporhodopirellula aestuarii TaxID=2950107 RepID=A0ABT0UA74_9BACT|nr:hypothetical protein [Aporhodopirellula aestuarii]MCM2373852.1 hypothetical protein [Aporhodopirellula aestuarii]
MNEPVFSSTKESKAGSDSVTELESGKFGASQDFDSEGLANSQMKVPQIRVGRIGATPTLSDIQSLRKLPLLSSQVNRAYGLAKSMTCRMLTPGASVKPTVTIPSQGESGTVGRIPAFTIGLTMDPSGRSKLPAVTRGQVDKYFEQHRLSIQPLVYSDDTGQLYFGTDCQAAFYEIDRPGIAIQAEPMIESAVARFRSLGIAASNQETRETSSSASRFLEAETGRTLVMAFNFEKADLTISSTAQIGRKVTELLFFHLPPSTAEATASKAAADSRSPISLDVFLTSDERRNLHRLDLHSWDLNSPTPDISADVRFDKMILMGLYPAEPVVTDIHYRSAGIISMELVSQLMNGFKEQTPMSLDEILDQFGLLSGSQIALDHDALPAGGELGDESDQQWLREMARLKYERLQKNLQVPDRGDQPTVRPRVPLITGFDD